MQIFNIEKEGKKKKCVCYIQYKDIKILKVLGIELNSYKSIKKLLATQDRDTSKSFIRVEDEDDIAIIRSNASFVVDYDRLCNGDNEIWRSYFKKIEREKKKITEEKKKIQEKIDSGNMGVLANDSEYNRILLKQYILDNKLVDLFDIKGIRSGYDDVKIPEVPYIYGFLGDNDKLGISVGLNPNEYYIYNLDQKKFSESFAEGVNLYKGDEELNKDLVPGFASDLIIEDLSKRCGGLENIDPAIYFEYKVSKDRKYFIIKVTEKPITFKKTKNK